MIYDITEKDGVFELNQHNVDTRWSSSNREDLVDLAERCPYYSVVTAQDDYAVYEWFKKNKKEGMFISRDHYKE